MIDAAQAQFGIPRALTITEGINGLPKAVLTHRTGARAEVYFHGTHVTSWSNAAGDELLFVSRASHFAPDTPIRGGIPVIFPQFGGGALPQHGLARISDWTLAATAVRADGTVTATWRLTDAPATQALWSYRFTLELEVALEADTLTLTYTAANLDERPFDFYGVLHTYFGVADICRTAVRGLQGITFIDSLREDAREVEERAAIRFAEETDRIYVGAPDRLHVDDEGNGRTITIEKTGMPDVVVWNPWIDKARRMADFGDDEYLRMVCVETGIMASARTLSPSASWCGITRFRCE